MEHTQGEWIIDKVKGGWDIICGIFTIAQVFDEFGPEPKEALANAYLIKAAPKLLAACEEGLHECERAKMHCHCPDRYISSLLARIERIEQAIAEAKPS